MKSRRTLARDSRTTGLGLRTRAAGSISSVFASSVTEGLIVIGRAPSPVEGQALHGLGPTCRAAPTQLRAPDELQATRVVHLRQKVLHPDGATTPLEPITVTVELERVGEAWKVASYQYRSFGQ